MQKNFVDHWNVVIRILRYLKKALGQGFLYEDKGDTQISEYCCADWAGSIMCVFIGSNIISWRSKKKMRLPNLVLNLNIGQ